MTFNRLMIVFLKISLVSMLILIPVFAAEGTVRAAGIPIPDKSAVVVYGGDNNEDAGRNGSGRQRIMSLYGLLRAYCSEVTLVSLNDYEDRLIQGKDYVIVVGVTQEPVNVILGTSLSSFDGEIGWVGGGIEKYAEYGLMDGFKVAGYSNQFAELTYPFDVSQTSIDGKAETMLIGQTAQVPKLVALAEDGVEVVGTLSDGKERFPYAIRSGRLWNIATYGSGDANGAAFKDTIRRLLGTESPKWPSVYIKLDDISPFVDYDKLEQAAQWLSEQGVPFILELRPVFVNTEYKEMERYFEVVRRIQHLGGTAVLGNLQGWKPPDEWGTYIESYSDSNVTSPESPETLIDLALEAYMDAGIYPLALSGPPDLLFDPEFANALSYFTTFVQNGSWQGYARDLFPEETWTGRFIADQLFSVGSLGRTGQLPGTDIASVVKFTGENDWEGLQMTVEKLKQSGASFANLRDSEGEVAFGDKRITVSDGMITVNGQRAAYEEKPPDDQTPPPAGGELSDVNKRISQVLFIVFIVAGIVILFFVLAFVAGKRIDRNKHLR
ncbi:DUF2334 domain-containing protein [Cohnella herbarum]|uniref:DUF2334 domain-containing protein n=1 Tax=Cohnella herbarum TaxID=2728023 RepID=A0A7Z2VIF3_9BACL|nr:DUF2334 domain-containing protein [Cohnella herbarum]QJD83607.1 DUF2334 domain-containing protein [Cohnella herbarum]